MRHTIVLTLAAPALLMVVDRPAVAQQAERHELRGDRVAVYNLAGEVRIVRGSGSAVTVGVTRGGEDAVRLRIETGLREGTASLRVVYPGDRIVYPELGRGSRSRLHVREDGTFGDGGRQVTVAGTGSGLRAHADLTIAVPAGRQVAVHHGAGQIAVTRVDADLLVDAAAGRVTAEGTRGFLNVDTGSGSVEVRDAEGDIRVDTGSGGVDLTGVRSRRLYVDTGSGRVTGTGIRSEEILVDTGSGGIRLSDVRATDIRLDTGSGGVELDLASDVRSLQIDTGSGGVTLRAPAELGAELDIETGSGGIDFDLPVTVSRAGRRHLVGRIGDGSGHIRIETGSGGVRLLGR